MESGNYYVAQVKGNQPKLLNRIHQIITTQDHLDFFEHKERQKGKAVTWSVFVYEAHVGILHKEWADLRRIIQVHKIVEGAESKHNDRYYISNLKNTDASFYHQGIRGHWGIENKLHWVKDVIHKEDKNRIRTGNGPLNMSIMSSIAINIHRNNGSDSILNSQIKCCCDIRATLNMIRT